MVRQNRHFVPANQCLRDAQMKVLGVLSKYKMARQFVPNAFVPGVVIMKLRFGVLGPDSG